MCPYMSAEGTFGNVDEAGNHHNMSQKRATDAELDSSAPKSARVDHAQEHRVLPHGVFPWGQVYTAGFF